MGIVSWCLLVVTSLLSTAVAAEQKTQAPAEVMLLGSFHFSNPGLDAVKVDQVDVTSKDNQDYLKGLSKRLAKTFLPTYVLLECDKKDQEDVSANYKKYLQGEYKLPVNEMYQIGFRVAKLANTPDVVCFDEREIHFNSELLMAAMDKKEQAAFGNAIQKFTREEAHRHQTLTLAELLVIINSPEMEKQNKGLYISVNNVRGESGGYEGADAVTSWWQRNFRMYANVQNVAQAGERLLVIAGGGHSAILKDFIALDESRVNVDVKPLLN